MIITSVKFRLYNTTHKYNIKFPTNIVHARVIDKKKKYMVWTDKMKKI